MVQWLEVHDSTAGGLGLIPGRELRFCKLCGTAKKKIKKIKSRDTKKLLAVMDMFITLIVVMLSRVYA